jgi:BMFP domain-containing protein YqiC
MTQTNNPFLDQFAKMMTDAAGAAQGVRREVETVMKAQGERVLNTMDVVKREEFEVVKAMAERARAENEKLEARIAKLEAALDTALSVAKTPATL